MNNKKTWIIGAAVLGVIALIIILVVVLKKPVMPEPIVDNTPITTTNTAGEKVIKKATPTEPEVVSAVNDIPTPTKTYTSSKLGFSFSYPAVWGNVEEKITIIPKSSNGSFEYHLTFSAKAKVSVLGKSNPYTTPVRGATEVDLTKDSAAGVMCPETTLKGIESKDKVLGSYLVGKVSFGKVGCTGDEMRYVIYTPDRKVTNVIFKTAEGAISNDVFLAVAGSVKF